MLALVAFVPAIIERYEDPVQVTVKSTIAQSEAKFYVTSTISIANRSKQQLDSLRGAIEVVGPDGNVVARAPQTLTIGVAPGATRNVTAIDTLDAPAGAKEQVDRYTSRWVTDTKFS